MVKTLQSSKQQAVVSNPTSKNLFAILLRENQLAIAAVRQLMASRMQACNEISLTKADYLGQHLLAEFKVDDLLDVSTIDFGQLILKAAQYAKATILRSLSFKDELSGDICGIVVVEESHFTVHYLAQKKLLAIDAFTCGDIDFHLAVSYIQEALKIQPYQELQIKRGARLQEAQNIFIPGVATLGNSGKSLLFFQPAADRGVGDHTIAEFYYCNAGNINTPRFVLDTFEEAIEAQNVAIQFSYVHEFQPQGVSAVIIGHGYHLTIHDWPEYGYAAIDLCNFNPKIVSKNVIDFLKEKFQPAEVSCLVFPRGNVALHLPQQVAAIESESSKASIQYS